MEAFTVWQAESNSEKAVQTSNKMDKGRWVVLRVFMVFSLFAMIWLF